MVVTGSYELEIWMTDNDDNDIGHCPKHGPATDSQPYLCTSKLEDTLVCKPEDRHDYIAFALGEQAWPSDTEGYTMPGCAVYAWEGDVSFAILWWWGEGLGNKANVY